MFKGFTGFSGLASKSSTDGSSTKTTESTTTTTTTTTKPVFNFGTGTSKPLDLANGTAAPSLGTSTTVTSTAVSSETVKIAPFSVGTNSSKDDNASKSNLSSDKDGIKMVTNGSDSKPLTSGTSASGPSLRSKYLHQLKSLNEGVLNWIKKHVGENPYCDLTPIFKDYTSHLDSIEKKFPLKDSLESTEKKSSPSKSASPVKSSPLKKTSNVDKNSEKESEEKNIPTTTAASVCKSLRY